MTQIGTSPNVVISAMQERLAGTPFTMFDFTPVGAVIATVGVLYLVCFIGFCQCVCVQVDRLMMPLIFVIML